MKLRRDDVIVRGALLAFTLLCTIAGCGYTTRTLLPEGVKTIHVETFRNSIDITKEVSTKDKYEIYRPNLEVDLRDAIVERIFLDGNLKSSSRDYADAVLEGEIVQYRKDPLRYQDEDITEYRVSIVCDIRLRSLTDSNIFLEQNNITGDATYFTTGTLQNSETDTLKKTASDLARRIVNRIVENW